MEALDHLGIMAVLVYLGKTRHLDHLGKVDSIKMEDPAIREHFMEEIVHMGDLAHSQQEQDQANMDLKEEAAIKVLISMGLLSLDRGVNSLHSVIYGCLMMP